MITIDLRKTDVLTQV